MEQNNKSTSTKRTLIIIGSVVAAIILCFVARAIYVNAVVDHAYDEAEKAYNRAYDKAERDIERTMRQFGY